MPHTPVHVTMKKRSLKNNTAIHPYTNFDRLVLVVSVIYPLSSLPQVIAVFNGRTEGVSTLSWVFFLICSSLFLVYGLRRRVPPMIIANSIWVIMDTLVITGIFIHGSVTWL